MAEFEEGVKFKVTAEDQASETLEDVGKNAKKSTSAVKRFASGAASAFSKIGAATVVLNQASELFLKFRDMGTAAIEMTREFVGANDPLMKSFQESSNSVRRLGAQVGVVLIKALNAVVKAAGPVIQSMSRFLQANQNLIGSKIVEYFETFATGTLVAVGKSITLVSKITSGWAMIWPTIKTGVNSFFAGLFQGLTKARDRFANFLEDLGADGLAGRVREAADSSRLMGQIFQESADTSAAAVHKIIDEQTELEVKIEQMGQAANRAIKHVATEAQKAFNGETVIGNINLEQRNQILEETKAREEALAEQKKLAAEAAKKFAEEQKAQADQEKARIESLASEYGALGSSIGGAFMSGYGAAEEGQDAVAEGFKAMTGQIIDSALEAMQKFITIKAAEGAANAAAGAGIGGPIIAAIAAAAMFSLIRGFIQMGFQGMARGGMVEGGVPGHDSVPIMAQAGEMVLSRDQVDRMRQDGNMGGSTVNIELNSRMPANKAELKKFVRQNIVPAMKDLKVQGML